MDKVLNQFTFSGDHVYNTSPAEAFKLMCPVRESAYLKDWEYQMIHSESGFAEMGCVFTTPHHGQQNTVWTVSLYDPKKFVIEFIRVTPRQELVTISIFLRHLGGSQTEAHIRYVHTALTSERAAYLKDEHEAVFEADLEYWEKALNYYLETGECLK